LVVATGPWIIVGTIDPADDRFGDSALLQSVGEATDLLSSADGMAEELLTAIIGVLTETHPVGEEEQCVGVVPGGSNSPWCCDSS
jgi:fructose-1,6-bisphosphatase/inositol monophosphatase family enzyme